MAAEPPDFAFTRDPSSTVLGGGFLVAANYMLFHENLLDLTHFNTLHRDSLGITAKTPPRYWTEGNTVRSDLSVDFEGWTPEQRAGLGVHDENILCWDDIGAFVTPAYHMGSVTWYSAQGVLPVMHVNHFMSPERAGRTHYWWQLGSSVRMSPDQEQQFRAVLIKAFNEDSTMLASIQNIVEREPRGRNYAEISFKGDVGGIKARQALSRIMAADGVHNRIPVAVQQI